jgi:hypothetical protein
MLLSLSLEFSRHLRSSRLKPTIRELSRGGPNRNAEPAISLQSHGAGSVEVTLCTPRLMIQPELPLPSEFAFKALRRIFLARSKRDLVAATEMPARSAISFNDLSVD